MSNKVQVQECLTKYGNEILKAMPAAMQSPQQLDRMRRIAMSELNNNPQLQRCDPMSIMGSLVHIATFGLEPGAGFGHAYLVPYGTKCTVIIGYRGYIELARRSGEVLSVHSRVVYANDHFDIEYGSDEKLIHKPNLDDPGDMIGVYAIARLKSGVVMFEYVSKNQVDDIKKTVKNQHVWKSHYDEMARKTAVRRLYKYLPCTAQMAAATMTDDTDPAEQNNWEIIDADYTPPEPQQSGEVIKEAIKEQEATAKDEALRKARESTINFLADLATEKNVDDKVVLEKFKLSSLKEIESMDIDALGKIKVMARYLKF